MSLIEQRYTDAADKAIKLSAIEAAGGTVRNDDFDLEGTGGTIKYEEVDSRVVVELPASSVQIKTTDSDLSVRPKHELIAITNTDIARTMTLLDITAIEGWICEFKDQSGGAGTNNITIVPPGAKTIDGQAQILIDTNYGSCKIYFDGSQYYTL